MKRKNYEPFEYVNLKKSYTSIFSRYKRFKELKSRFQFLDPKEEALIPPTSLTIAELIFPTTEQGIFTYFAKYISCT